MSIWTDDPPMSGGWQPIATAPRDGQQILLAYSDFFLSDHENRKPVVIGSWDEDVWDIPFDDDWRLDTDFSHWMPLPAPPKA